MTHPALLRSPLLPPPMLLLVYRDRWAVCMGSVRNAVGNDAFEAWFSSMRFVEANGKAVRLTVISDFLKRWILNRYAGPLLEACQAEWPDVEVLDLQVRTCVLRDLRIPKVLALPPPAAKAPKACKLQGNERYKGWPPRLLFPGHPNIDTDTTASRVKIQDIQHAVARQYNVSRADLLSARRTANVVRPRQVAMLLCKQITGKSLPEIGRKFGGRDHTTVLHACSKISWLIGDRSKGKPVHWRNAPEQIDHALAEEIEALKQQLAA